MLETRRIELQAQLDEARAANDTAREAAILRTRDREVLECTAHTAERLKRVEKTVSETREMVFELLDNFKAMENKAKGAKLMWDALKIAAASGGGALILKALNAGVCQ